jgi:hypothetical protein
MLPSIQFAQMSNFSTHLTLRNLRPEGSTERKIPFGYGFNWVSCPNYFFEIMAWTAFTGLTRSWAGKFHYDFEENITYSNPQSSTYLPSCVVCANVLLGGQEAQEL